MGDDRPEVVLLVVPWGESVAAKDVRDPRSDAIVPVDRPPTPEEAASLVAVTGEVDGVYRYGRVVVMASDPAERAEILEFVRGTIPRTLAQAYLGTCAPPYAPERCETIEDRARPVG